MEESAQLFNSVAPELLNPRITPLLRFKIEDAIRLHQRDKDSQSVAAQKNLEQVRQDLTQHWNRFFASPIILGSNMITLDLFAKTLGGLLLCEYSSEHLPVAELELSAYIWSYGNEQQRALAVKSWEMSDTASLDQQVRLNMGLMLSEFMLDREHVERRFKAVCEGVNLVETLLQQGKRSDLDDLMVKDEQTLRNLATCYEPCRVALDIVVARKEEKFGPKSTLESASTQPRGVQNVAHMFRATQSKNILRRLKNFAFR